MSPDPKYSDLYLTQDAEATVRALQEGFQFDVIEALLKPLDSSDLNSEPAKLLITSVNNNSAIIEECIYDSLIKQMPYMRLNETISCGLSNSQSEFIIEASNPSISVSLRIPLA